MSDEEAPGNPFSEDPDDVNEDPDEDVNEASETRAGSEDDWEFEEGREAALAIRGYPTQYDLNFVVLARVDPSDLHQDVDLVCLASDRRTLIEDVDLDQPAERLEERLQDLRIELQLDGSGIDNQVVQDKFRSLFLDREFTGELNEYLRNNEDERAVDLIERRTRDGVFPGSEIELDVRLARWSSPNVVESNDTEESRDLEDFSGKTSAGSRMLRISPKIRPFLGSELGSLQPGDVFEVRVIGESATRLRSEFLDAASSDDQPYSKPLEARLVSMEQGDVPQEIRFLVELADGVYGVGTSARDARVYANEQLVQSNQPSLFYSLRVVLFACSILLFVSLILLFVMV